MNLNPNTIKLAAAFYSINMLRDWNHEGVSREFVHKNEVPGF